MLNIAVIGTAGRREDGPKMTPTLYFSMYRDFVKRVSGQIETAVEERTAIVLKHNTKKSPKQARSDVRTTIRTRLISGGAAWADHLAVSLFSAIQTGHPSVRGLGENNSFLGTLYLPATFLVDGVNLDHIPSYMTTSPRDPGDTCNYYHHLFGRKMNGNKYSTLRGIAQVVNHGGVDIVVKEGFKNRNICIAQSCNVLFAYTWGEGHLPKEGGTRQTWDNCSAPTKIHIPLSSLER